MKPALERHGIWTQLYLLGTRTLDLAKSMQKHTNFEHFQDCTHRPPAQHDERK